MADNTDLRGKDDDSHDGLTQEMNRIQATYGHTSGEARMPLRERSKAAWRFVQPHLDRTAWWTMLTVSVVVIALDVNARFGGFIGKAIEWIRSSVMSRYPSLAFVSGMAACYILVIRGRKWFKKDGD